MNRDIATFLEDLGPAGSECVEISGSVHEARGWKRYDRLEYPAFDLCDPPTLGRTWDVVLCEQVLEHVSDPCAAVRTLHDLARPGGWVVVSTPFLIRIHPSPTDYWRFTPAGLRVLLERAGLDVRSVERWGNRAAVRANLRRWVPYRRWRSLRSQELVPVVVWAYAQRPTGR